MEKRRRFLLLTFGCQMNVSDSEKIRGLLQSQGYQAVSDAASADIVFINTCAVRDKAERKLHHTLDRLGALKRRRPELIVGVGGCVAQLSGTQILERAPFVDVLVGTRSFPRLPELLRRAENQRTAGVDLDRDADAFVVPPDLIAHANPVRAYVTVMEGCNQVCSFCVVPRARGSEVHRPGEDVVAEVMSLVDRGFPEVMLLGQTVNAYRYGPLDFPGLLDRVGVLPGLRRLRFTTSHPAHVGPRLAQRFRDHETICPYLHLPVQSGSDRVLASMRRGYTRSEYLEKVALLREAQPGLSLTSDIIVGYPGETETEFQATLDLVDAAGFDGLFVFHYSPRPRTTAFGLEDDVPLAVKKSRFQEVNQRQQCAQIRRNAGRIGGREQVLVENIDSAGRAMGRTREFRIVHFDGPVRIRDMVEVEITGAGANALVGRLVSTTDSLTCSSGLHILY